MRITIELRPQVFATPQAITMQPCFVSCCIENYLPNAEEIPADAIIRPSFRDVPQLNDISNADVLAISQSMLFDLDIG